MVTMISDECLSELSEDNDIPVIKDLSGSLAWAKILHSINIVEQNIKNRPSRYKRAGEMQSTRTIQRHMKQLKDQNTVLTSQGIGKITNFFKSNTECIQSEDESWPTVEILRLPGPVLILDNNIIWTAEPQDSEFLVGLDDEILPSPSAVTSAQRSRHIRSSPDLKTITTCLTKLDSILHPRWKSGNGFKDPKLNVLFRTRLEMMAAFLRPYQASKCLHWIRASELASHTAGKGPWLARRLREWVHAFILDENDLPISQYGRWNSSILEDEDLAQEIHLHLQSIGQYVSASDIVRYIDTKEMKERLNLKKTITEQTARKWMKRIGYRWQKTPKGQYKDGHERADVVAYRQNIFLPAWNEIEKSTRKWDNDGTIISVSESQAQGQTVTTVTVVWVHDESTFYANDRRKLRWVHKSEAAVPQAKGEGASLMFADFVSADYGWL